MAEKKIHKTYLLDSSRIREGLLWCKKAVLVIYMFYI